mmetsp:Transcript_24852/g.38480  ORF Transcript_24852/g.38480 Transcript_24852/m.38480 type:complete len:256 (+) Transcript_24852:261-1028(+)
MRLKTTGSSSAPRHTCPRPRGSAPATTRASSPRDPTMTAWASTPRSPRASAHHRGSMPYREKLASERATTSGRRGGAPSPSGFFSPSARARASRQARRVASMVVSPDGQNWEWATMRWRTCSRAPRLAGAAPQSTKGTASAPPECPRIAYSYRFSSPCSDSMTSIAASSMRVSRPSRIWKRYIDPDTSRRNRSRRRPFCGPPSPPPGPPAPSASGVPRRLNTSRSPAAPSTSRVSSSSPSGLLRIHARSRPRSAA